MAQYTGEATLDEGVDEALRKALFRAEKDKPARIGALGFGYEVTLIEGRQCHKDKGNTLSVTIEIADFD